MSINEGFEITKPIVPYSKSIMSPVPNPGKSPTLQKVNNHGRLFIFDFTHISGPITYEFLNTPQLHSFIEYVCFIPMLITQEHKSNTTSDKLLLGAASGRAVCKQKFKKTAFYIILLKSEKPLKLSRKVNLIVSFNRPLLRLLQSSACTSPVPLYPGLHGSAIGPPALLGPFQSRDCSVARSDSYVLRYVLRQLCAQSTIFSSYEKFYISSNKSMKTDVQQLAIRIAARAAGAMQAPCLICQQKARARAIAVPSASAHASSTAASASQCVRLLSGLACDSHLGLELVSLLGSFPDSFVRRHRCARWNACAASTRTGAIAWRLRLASIAADSGRASPTADCAATQSRRRRGLPTCPAGSWASRARSSLRDAYSANNNRTRTFASSSPLLSGRTKVFMNLLSLCTIDSETCKFEYQFNIIQ